MNRKEKIESITQHEDRNKLDWDDNVLVQPEEGEGSGKNGTERKHFKMSLRKLAPDTDWSEPTDDTPPSGKLVKDSLEQIELTPGPQGDDGLSAYEVAVEEGFEGDETAWLASLKGADGDEGKSAYEVAVEEGYTGTEQEFAEALADIENKVDKSKIVTTWNSPKDNEVPSAKLVKTALDGINVSGKEDKSNKITRLYDGVTDTQYASAKAVWDEFQIMKRHISAVTSWAQLTDIVQQNDAGKYFGVGDEFMCRISGLPPQIVYILGLNQDKKVGDPTAPTMSLAFKNILWRQSFDSAESSPSNPDSARKTYGNARWTHSNLRQFLNSDDAKYTWASTHPYDNAPDSYDADSLVVYNGPGFLHRVESSLRDVIIPVTKLTAQANIDGTGADQTEDKIFLMSRKEVGLGSEGDGSGEFVYQYYEDSINADRIKLEASGSAYYWLLRSPNVSYSSYVRLVQPVGSLTHSTVRDSYGVSPAFVIG